MLTVLPGGTRWYDAGRLEPLVGDVQGQVMESRRLHDGGDGVNGYYV